MFRILLFSFSYFCSPFMNFNCWKLWTISTLTFFLSPWFITWLEEYRESWNNSVLQLLLDAKNSWDPARSGWCVEAGGLRWAEQERCPTKHECVWFRTFSKSKNYSNFVLKNWVFFKVDCNSFELRIKNYECKKSILLLQLSLCLLFKNSLFYEAGLCM